ncbi:MAG: 3'(2'),5'-bisphosphate nucleotidase CysQ [Xanthomonadaceae bacterium]|nr:3'(2'),5'-bisphosphate nucleotidase CysQ [Xanthomonadaceae bacterium]
MLKLDALREGVIAIAHQAASEILDVYESEFAVQQKDDASPLTAADLAAHRWIVAGLAALTPDIPVLSEESKAIDIRQRKQWPRFWLVDPLDGTREFVKRNGEFTVNIALIEDGVATFGVIQQPVTGLLWHGVPGQGAFRREDGVDVAIHARIPAHAPLRVAASRSHRDARTDAVIAALPGCLVLGCGSSLKFCRIAEGAMDLYPRFGPTSEWDTAAGQAILEAAGGAVLDPQGRPFRYNQRDTLLNGDFVALGDVALRARLPA